MFCDYSFTIFHVYNFLNKFFFCSSSSIMQIPGESTLKRNFQQIQEREGRHTPNPLYQPPAPPRGAQPNHREHHRDRHHHPVPQPRPQNSVAQAHQMPPAHQPQHHPAPQPGPSRHHPPPQVEALPRPQPVHGRIIGKCMVLGLLRPASFTHPQCFLFCQCHP